MIKIYKKYELEKNMCDELTAYAKLGGWTVYPEQGGWDLLLIRNKIQVGVQAKLRPTIKLLSQALVPEILAGPHYRAVAVGNTNYKEKDDFSRVAQTLRLVFIDMGAHPDYWLYKATQGFTRGQRIPWIHYRHFPSNMLWIPSFVPKLDAGIPAPKTVNPWKVAAVKMEFIANRKGWVSIIDAREVVQREVPDEVGKSYPRTLLQSYFKCTNEKDPRNTRCHKWVLKKAKPSNHFSYVFEALKGENGDA